MRFHFTPDCIIQGEL